MNRLEANQKIINLLSATVEQHPDWRFNEILQNLDVYCPTHVDQYYEESEATLKRVKQMVTIR
jgi:hypothetical protein